MARADEAFRAESRATVFFGVVTSKSDPLTFDDSPRFVRKVKVSLYAGVYNTIIFTSL
jgi:hypothetical protein